MRGGDNVHNSEFKFMLELLLMQLSNIDIEQMSDENREHLLKVLNLIESTIKDD